MRLRQLLFKLLSIGIFIGALSCSDSDEPASNSGEGVDYAACEKLFGGVWRQSSRIFYDESKDVDKRSLWFTSMPYYDAYLMCVDSEPKGYWFINDSGQLFLSWAYDNTSPMERGELSVSFGGGYCDMLECSSNTLVYQRENSDGTINKYTYKKTGSNNSPDRPDGGSGVLPEVMFYDFTATKTSLTVQFRLLNKDECGVKHIYVAYDRDHRCRRGCANTISGTMIRAEIKNLKAGTEYYVKCRVVGNAGYTETDPVKCITNYK